jgi:hypothetical protein
MSEKQGSKVAPVVPAAVEPKMDLADLDVPAVAVQVLAPPTASGVPVLKVFVGCEVRDGDFKQDKVEKVDDCVHIRQDQLPKPMKASDLIAAKKATPRARIMCPLCSKQVGEERTHQVWRHNQKPPNRPFPVYLSDFTHLSWTRFMRAGGSPSDVVLMGLTWREQLIPCTIEASMPPTKVLEEARAQLEKAGVYHEKSFGVYLVAML